MNLDSTIFYPHGIQITDWVQALGALIAVIAGIFGFIKLFRKDKDKQIQIEFRSLEIYLILPHIHYPVKHHLNLYIS